MKNPFKEYSKLWIFVIAFVVTFVVTPLIVFMIIWIPKAVNETKSLEYINPDQLELLCGNGTKPQGQMCVPDNNVVAQQLIDQGFIRDVGSEVVFTPDYTNEYVEEIPKWFITWVDNGAYSCKKTIRNGICNIPDSDCNAACSCMDCAGWRGGNSTDCTGRGIGGGRVMCNHTNSSTPNMCQCTDGHCAVNGLCVSPYVLSNTDGKNCCPGCAYVPPNKIGGCAGSVDCDPSSQCKESIVELPGVRFIPDLNDPRVVLVNTKCESGDSDDPSCFHPDHPNATRRQAFIKIKTDINNPFDSLCPRDYNTASGENEYECALKCGNTGGMFDGDQTTDSQVECSKRCLPKIWRWYPVFEEMPNSDLRYTGGYYQSDELMRYLPSDIDLRVCPSGTCETKLNQPIDFTQFNNCTECNQCGYEYSKYMNNNGFQDIKYECGSCKQCLLDQVTENGENYQVTCKNMTNCNTCKNEARDLVFKGVNFNECDTCLETDPNDPKSGCKVYTLDPYENIDGGVEYHKDSISYNHGGDPYDVDNGTYYPSSRTNADCKICVDPNEVLSNNISSVFNIINGRPLDPSKEYSQTCDNTLDGKAGWGSESYDFTNYSKWCSKLFLF